MAKSRRNAPRGKAKPAADQPETGSVEDEVQEVTMETSEGSVDLPENEALATDAPKSDDLSETPSEPEASDIVADDSQTEDVTPEEVASDDASPVMIEDEGQELSGGDDSVPPVETSDQEPAVAEMNALMACCPKCFRCKYEMLSGSVEGVFLVLGMASAVMSVVN